MLKSADYIYNNIIIADEVHTTKKYCKKAQVGVDLSIKDVEVFTGPGYTLKDKTYAAPSASLEKVTFTDPAGKEHRGWHIGTGSYIIKLNEGCSFAENTTGLIFLRSSLNRSGVDIVSAVWDPGYTSNSEEGIYPMSIRITVHNVEGFYLEENARVCQLIVPENEKTDLYNGQWQGGATVSKLV